MHHGINTGGGHSGSRGGHHLGYAAFGMVPGAKLFLLLFILYLLF